VPQPVVTAKSGFDWGGAITSMATAAIPHAISFGARLLGFGDYSVSHNSLLAGGAGNQVPAMHSDNGTVRVQRREFLTDVTSSRSFVNRRIAITPTNYACFPWLSTFANNFEQYRILGMVFEYKTLSGAISTSQALGSITLATQYNVSEPAFANKSQALNHYFGCSSVPSASLLHAIECMDMYDPYKVYWTRHPGEVGLPDRRLNDYGVLNIITQGQTEEGPTLGELWVSYDVILIKPRLPTEAESVTIYDPLPPGRDPDVFATHVPEIDECPPCPVSRPLTRTTTIHQ
jgi:hypothetical protein